MRMIGAAMAVCVLAGCGRTGPDGIPAAGLPSGTRQALVMKWVAGPDASRVAELVTWELGKSGWTPGESIPCIVGKNGIAPPGEKREGDGRTPSGVYRIGLAFGYEPSVETGLDYRQATADDFWVDDPDSPQYNRWVHGKPDAKSFEKLRRDDDAYKYAAVIEYNTDPIAPGKGSAIFLHVWRSAGGSTDGCVAVLDQNMPYLLRWLDRRLNPVIVITEPDGRIGRR
jgi:L,D-peptidoglycan transpeptidase YkuD (ErfK/YbiS/YcfS/YnhG family)